MSIGIAVKCADGIMLCADTQMTWSGSHKSYERKIHTVGRDNPRACVAFTYAGNPELMKMFAEKFSNIFRDAHYVANVKAIRQTLVDVLGEMESVIANDSIGLYMLCGITVDGESPILLKTTGQIIRPVDLYDYVGVGDCSVVRYLSKVLFQSKEIEVKAAVVLGTYLITQAKAFIDECGGDTDIVTLLPNGVLQLRDQGMARNYEDRTGMCEWHLARAISSVSNFKESESRLDSDLRSFINHLKSVVVY